MNQNLTQPIPKGEKQFKAVPPQPPMPLWPFKELLSYSWKYFKPLIKKIWPLIALLFIVGAIPILYEIIIPTSLVKENLVLAVISGLLSVLSWFINMVFMGFVIPVVSLIILHSFYQQAPESLNNALKKLIPLAMPYTIVVLLGGLAIFGGFTLFIVPGIILSIWLSFSTIALIVENRRGFEALLRSVGLVSGYSWDVFWRFVGVTIVTAIASFLWSLPVFVISIMAVLPMYTMMGQSPAAVRELTSGQLPFYLRIITGLGSLWNNLMTLLIPLFVFTFTYLLFRNLKQIKGEAVAYDKKKLFKGFMILGIVGAIALIVGVGFLIFWLGGLYNMTSPY